MIMWVLGSGRKHFLEFLRNTSIQFFFMILVAVSGGKLNTLISRQDYKNAIPMGLITLLILLLLWLAAHANIKSFFMEFKNGATPGLNPYLDSLPDEDLKLKNRLTLAYLAKHGKSAVAEAWLLIIGFYFVIAIGGYYSVTSAQNFISRDGIRNCTPAAQPHRILNQPNPTVPNDK
jgi:hypothetical protein